MRRKYRFEYHLAGGKTLVCLYPAKSLDSAERIAGAPNVQRSIFRTFGVMRRSRSAFEYLDTAPVVVSVSASESVYV